MAGPQSSHTSKMLQHSWEWVRPLDLRKEKESGIFLQRGRSERLAVVSVGLCLPQLRRTGRREAPGKVGRRGMGSSGTQKLGHF